MEMKRADILKAYFQSVLNKPYIWGGQSSLTGFDCSGFAQEALACLGLDPEGDQTSGMLRSELIARGWVKVSTPRFGAILSFGSLSEIKHTGIAVNETIMIEAGGGGSANITLNDAIRTNATVRYRPIKRRSDLIDAIWHPSLAE
jgi:cell wall-associated NlpC family hydrolase